MLSTVAVDNVGGRAALAQNAASKLVSAGATIKVAKQHFVASSSVGCAVPCSSADLAHSTASIVSMNEEFHFPAVLACCSEGRMHSCLLASQLRATSWGSCQSNDKFESTLL